ncbi:helix-hairpin-helix domain-containing protein [Comamonas squillarum]|uniref:Helix-hairpin-helix domain-containing protein n=1 Tax=Comamonas squillarum TaxID=2977320 RepID=A0ABY6A678_9BURK|nr:helix-hairpin-helix domain-containing protein [Comamonas sp. PR12]UXC19966.1 helix-hairpin-helix domain-containing protein [Comamonas sp. PR12]
MNRTLVDSTGRQLRLGRELGKGGEGSVFELPDLPKQAAKLYHKPLDLKKQAKLSFMARSSNQELEQFTAWPQTTLHETAGGPVVGFVMPKMSSRAELHMVYGPAHRKKDYPRYGWDFLLFVARNVASCVDVVHRQGHVLGDVNQSSFMAAKDSTVVLIDTDSFQVSANGTMHMCEVGVAYFTPPELQGTTSFKTVPRTQNHDNFGLALLIFHLLFGGRHPYAGVPLAKGAGDALESDIQAMRYAYARDAQRRGIGVPPRSYPIDLLPPSAEALMHAAFTEQGASGQRPTARQWVNALDEIRKSLLRCSKTKTHAYPDHLTTCPWCVMANDPFPDPDIHVGTANLPLFDFEKVWSLIDTLKLTGNFGTLPNHTTYTASAAPARKHGEGNHMLPLGLGVAALFLASFVAGKPWLIFAALVAGILLRSVARGYDGRPEVVKRREAVRIAEAEYKAAVAALHSGVGAVAAEFQKRKDHLNQAVKFLRQMPARAADEMRKLDGMAREYHLRKHLEQFYIDDVQIRGLGPARKAALQSFGIETAAEVVEADVRQVKGFGGALTQALLDWRASHERSFVFLAHMRPPASEIAKVQQKQNAERAPAEMLLRKGPDVLRGLISDAQRQHSMLLPRVETAAKLLTQANADLSEAINAMQ